MQPPPQNRAKINHSRGLSLEEVLKLAKERLSSLINNEAADVNTRVIWKCLEQILKHNFRTKSTVDFWTDHLRFMYNFLKMDVNSQTLFIRLMTYKKEWFCLTQINKSVMEQEDLGPCYKQLLEFGFAEKHPNMDFDTLFTMMQVDDLKKLCKKFKLTVESSKAAMQLKITKHCKSQKDFFGIPLTNRGIKMGLQILGDCFHLDDYFDTLLTIIMTVYCPITMNSTLSIGKADINLRQNFFFVMRPHNEQQIEADYVRRIDMYQNFEQLFLYVNAMKLECKMHYLHIQKQVKDYEEILLLANDIKARVSFLINNASTSSKELFDHYESLPDYLLKYTELWVYTRCLSFAAEVMQSHKNYEDANNLFSFLLNRDQLQKFNQSQRGEHYQRIAINLHNRMHDHKKTATICKAGLLDPLIPDKYKLLFQDRLTSLGKVLGQQNVFQEPQVVLQKWEIMEIEAPTLKKNLGDSRVNRFGYIDEAGNEVFCSVEQSALNYFLDNDGYNDGIHSEGCIWHFVYALVFFDIIYDRSIPNVWISELQTRPLDRNSSHFYYNRKKQIDERLDELKRNRDKLTEYIKLNYGLHKDYQSDELFWDLLDDDIYRLERFLMCCPGKLLIEIFKRFSTDNRHTRSGFPDLVVWNSETFKMAVVEVKGPGDKLSSKQELCLDLFVRNGVNAIECHVAPENKYL